MSNSSLDKARKTINEIDRQMAELFIKRMKAVETVAEYKKERGLAILDEAREKEVLKRNSTYVQDEILKEYYVDFLRNNMSLSKEYQARLVEESTFIHSNTKSNLEQVSFVPTDYRAQKSFITKLHLDLGQRCYDIYVGRGTIDRAGELFNLDRKVLIVTDSGVPKEYAERVKALCRKAKILVIPQGEESKSIDVFNNILREMLDFGMTRSDCVVAVGGGVVGDLSGFCAASFMRGIDFYNIPTTLLSQVDSSIGGKTAINLAGVKNIVGAFYQPKGVIIDPDTLKTLPKRHISNGLAEAIKMATTFDKELFEFIENNDFNDEALEKIIIGSLLIKKQVVECDEREGGLRKVLNFGHTLGHGIEAQENMGGLCHGECVALGMMAVCSKEVKERLVRVLKKAGLPTKYEGDIEQALSFVIHDKKCDGNLISVIYSDQIGSYRIEKTDVSSFCSHVRKELK